MCLAVAIACSQQTEERELSQVRSALTADQERVFGFESALSDWSASGGTLSASSNVTQGNQALGVIPQYYADIRSIQLSSLGSVDSTFSFDFRIPETPGWGEVQAFILAPSQEVDAFLGSKSLSSLTVGSYQTLSFNVPQAVRTALEGTYSDLRIRLVIIAPPSSQPYLLDNLVLASGSGGGGSGDDVFSVLTPEGISLEDTFMSASNHLRYYSQAKIGVTGALPALANFGSVPTLLQAEAKAYGNLYSVPDVDLYVKTKVSGFVKTTGAILMQGVGTPDQPEIGAGFPGEDSIPSSTTTWSVPWPSSNGGDVIHYEVSTPVDHVLSPGAYGVFDIHDRNRMHLSTGTYYFESFNTEPLAEVHLHDAGGPIILYVRSSFTYKGKFVDAGIGPDRLFVGYAGTSDAFVQAPFTGTFVAPNAAIKLENPTSAQHVGSFFGHGIDVASGQHTVLHVPFADWGAVLEPAPDCLLGDTDEDEVDDCTDQCITDPNKATPGVCGCGREETDADEDGIPDCRESFGCDDDPANAVLGQCGGCGTPFANTTIRCTDSVCPVEPPSGESWTCDGAGTCGDSSACQPDPSCVLRRDRDSDYWICTGPTTREQARTNCAAVPGRRLVRIDSRVENALIASLVTTQSWTGANDLSNDGDWRWSTTDGNDGSLFWTGGPGGQRVELETFEAWQSGQPAVVGDCGTIREEDGAWAAVSCSTQLGYVCEQPSSSTTSFPPTTGSPICPFWLPEGVCNSGASGDSGPGGPGSPDCIPETSLPDPELALAQLEACEAAYDDADPVCSETDPEGCAEFCEGYAALPDPGSTCPALEPNEIGLCALQDVIETGCTPGENCCTWSQLLDLAPRRFSVDAEGFSYVDDPFRGTAQPAYASGQHVANGGNPGGALQVALGGVDGSTVTGMSGGWAFSFTLAAPAFVNVEFDYNLTQTGTYEPEELSEVLLSVDGQLQGTRGSDTVATITGDGNDGPALSTGWDFFARPLGTLGAGTHQVVIGAYNNQKTAIDEITTLLLDNIRVSVSAHDCPAGFTCGVVYPEDCFRCDEEDDTGCSKDCAGFLRCGKPLAFQQGNTQVFCGDDGIFANDRCDVTEICPAPEASGESDPLTDPRSNFDEPVLDVETVFGEPALPLEEYADDPPCLSTPCNVGQEHRWCHYSVDVWNDPAVPGVPNPAPEKHVPADSQQGTSGNALVSFTFDPGVTLDYEANPLPFGEFDFSLDATASLLTEVNFELPGVGKKRVTILDANLAVHIDRCHATARESYLEIFGQNLFPTEEAFDSSDDQFSDIAFEPATCTLAMEDFKTAIGRAKKAYKDALELIRQYQEHQLAGTAFPEDFCESIVADPPADFPAHSCAGESAAATINRFIIYYHHQAQTHLAPALNRLKEYQLAVGISLPEPLGRETQSIVEVTFPLGPIPMRLEVDAFMEYGLSGNVGFDLTPAALLGSTGELETLAFARVNAMPYASAGVALFVGAGFGVPGFSVSAGVEGTISLGRVKMNNFAGAGIGVQVLPDTRDFPSEIAAAADPTALSNKITLFPPGGTPSEYRLSLLYRYGSDVEIDDIMKGTIAGRVRLKVAFFSKTWRKVLLKFPGFGGVTIPLLRGGEGAELSADASRLWGTVQMPLPFVQLAEFAPEEELTGTPVASLDTSAVEELFFDGLCECSLDNVACERHAQCCNRPASRCFSDPVDPQQPTCQGCRPGRASCNDESDCCNPNATCEDVPDGLPAGVKACSCEPLGDECGSLANCCSPGNLDGTAKWCEDDPTDDKEDVAVCRSCRSDGEPCASVDDCCPLSGFFQLCRSGVCFYDDVH